MKKLLTFSNKFVEDINL